MQELELSSWTDENRCDGVGGVILKRDKKRLDIQFGGNGDLYFSLTNYENDPTFVIAKDNMAVYDVFDKLYKEVFSGEVFLGEEKGNLIIDQNKIHNLDYHAGVLKELGLEKYKKANLERAKNAKLIKDDIITWCSDDFDMEVAPFFQIIPEKDAYIVDFGKPKLTKELEQSLSLTYPRGYSVRLRNSGSNYDPFNIIFMRAYNSLKEIVDVESVCHQIHIEEYLFEREDNMKRRLVRK